MALEEGNYLGNVRAQYEDYPYPARDPQDEKKRLLTAKSTSLDCLNYYAFDGRRDFSKPFRVLVPGGGTGDCTIYLAEQLRNTPAEIVYLDMSETSMNVAKERAAIRQLENITWIHDSILNIPALGLGKFDFITCTGVLHHLADPQAGLDALKSVLDPDGSMFIMVYGTYGRTAVYHMQNLMRRVNAGFDDIREEISNTRKILSNLPPTNWFAASSQLYQEELQSDIGVYDLLLHEQDRSYTVPELYEFVESSGLELNKLYNPDNVLGDLLFQPETFIRDPALLAKIKTYPFREQAAICELIFGALAMQNCFISFKDKSTPDAKDLSLVPNVSIMLSQMYDSLLAKLSSGAPSVPLTQAVSLKNKTKTLEIFKAIDGKRSIEEIVAKVVADAKQKTSFDEVLAEFYAIYDILLKIDGMFLRAPDLPVYPTVPEMQKRVSKLY